MRRPFHALCAGLLACSLIPACANNSNRSDEHTIELLTATPPLESPFVPVNLSINPGEWVNESQAQTLRYLGKRIQESGLFAEVSPGANRWPVTVELNFSFRSVGNQAVEFTNMMASAATLFIIPAVQDSEYVLKVSIYSGPLSIGDREYKLNKNRVIGLFKMTDIDQPAVDHLVELMKQDFVSQPPLPKRARPEAPAPAQDQET